MHSTHGQQVLEHFLYRGAGCRPTWTTGNVIEEQVAAIREQVGDRGAPSAACPAAWTPPWPPPSSSGPSATS